MLFGSGETTPTGRAVHERLLSDLERPVAIAVLETPAGFQPNSALVAAEVKEFLEVHLQNHQPKVTVVPARKLGTAHSPDDPVVVKPLLDAAYIFMGPGSPTFAVRNLRNTLAWRHMIERHREGAYLCFASAGTLAVGAHVLPVYEMFKAGDDPHWVEGLDFFGRYGLELAVVPHWNNAEGGSKLDTSRCFMGVERMAVLKALLPSSCSILGIDEHTAVIFDFQRARAAVHGKGSVTVWGQEDEKTFPAGVEFPLTALGAYRLPAPLPFTERPPELPTEAIPQPPRLPRQVASLVEQREEARRRRDWALADALRSEIAEMGFELTDTPQGARWRYVGKTARGAGR